MGLRHAWIRKMLLSYLPIFYVVALVLIFIYVYSTNQLLERNAVQSNRSVAENVAFQIEHSLENIDSQMIQELLLNDQIAQFLEPSQINNALIANEVSRNIREWLIRYKDIDSIYLVRYADGKVISQNVMENKEQYGDFSFLSQVDFNHINKNWSGVRKFQEFDYEQPRSVVTIVRKIAIDGDSPGIIVINVKVSQLVQWIQQTASTDNNFFRLTDAQGMEIASVPGTWKAGSTQPASILELDLTDWRMESGLRNVAPYSLISASTSVWMILAIGIVILCNIWLIYVTKRNYRPIASIMSRIAGQSLFHLNRRNAGMNMDEFGFIESAMNELIQQSFEHRQQAAHELETSREYYFRKLVEGLASPSVEQWNEMAEKFGLQPTPNEVFMVSIIEMDHYLLVKAKYKDRDLNLFKFVVHSALKEFIQKHQLHAWCEWISAKSISCLFQFSSDETDMEEKTAELHEDLLQWVQSNLDFTLTVGMGNAVKGVSFISESYLDASDALKYKTTLGMNRLIRSNPLESGSFRKDMYLRLEEVRGIVASFRLLEEGWKNKLEQHMEHLKRSRMPSDEVVNLIHFLIHQLSNEVKELLDQAQQQIQVSYTEKLTQSLEPAETLEEMYHSILPVLENNYAFLKQVLEKRNHHFLMKKIRNYVEREYGNSELSLDYLSESFQVGPKYLSQLFKDEFGENFIDFLTRVRIDNAKKRLADSQRAIAQIANEVGYQNPVSFGRMFKKRTGITPGEYRELMKTRE